MKKCYNDENGRSMIEMLGVLAIIGVLSVGGIAGYSKAMYRYRLNKTIEEITQIAGNVRAFFAPQKSYAGLASGSSNGRALLKKAKIIPEEMWDKTDNKYKHQFGGDFLINTYNKIWSNACFSDSVCRYLAFYIRLDYIPYEACVDLIIQDWSNLGVNVIEVHNYENPTYNGSAYIIPPVNLDYAVKLCEGENDTNEVDEFYFYFDVDDTQGNAATYIANTLNKFNISN